MTRSSDQPLSNAGAARVLCIGPISVDLLQFEADRSEIFYPGGNAVICGSVLSKMGTRCSVLGQVGNDQLGEQLVEHLESHGADTALILRRTDLNTKVGRNFVSRNGSWRRLDAKPALFPYLGFDQADIDPSDFTHLHVGGLQGLLRSVPEATFRVLESCRTAGLSMSIGLASGTTRGSDLARAIGEGADLFCTLDELRNLLQAEGLLELSTPGVFRSVGPKSLLITLGSKGAAALLDAASLCLVNATGTAIESHEVDPTTGLVELLEQQLAERSPTGASRPAYSVGAGDVFSAVYTAAILSDLAPEPALLVAARAASLSVHHVTWDEWMSRVPDLPALLQIGEERRRG